MPPQQDNVSAGSEGQEAAQPPLTPKRFWKIFLNKMAISARLFGKEIHRKKLKWFDLRRADYGLGKKAYETESLMSEPNATIDRIKKIQIQIEALGDRESSTHPSRQKLKTLAKEAGNFAKTQLLRFKRNQLFRKLGGQLRPNPDIDASLVAQAEQSRSVSKKLEVVNSEIRTLTAETYVWARRPLLTSAIVLAVVLLCSGLIHHQAQETVDLSTPRKAVQSFERALDDNGMDLASSLALGTEQQLNTARVSHDMVRAYCRMSALEKAKFSSEEDGKKEWNDYLNRWATATEAIEGETATVGTPSEINGSQMIWGGYRLRKIDASWEIDLGASGLEELWAGKYAVDPARSKQYLKDVDEIIDGVEKGSYKDYQEAIHAWNDKVDAAKVRAQQNAGTNTVASVQNLPTRASARLASNETKNRARIFSFLSGLGDRSGDADAWGNSYRNAKFITREEFLKRLGPVHLVVRERSGVNECVRNLEDIVKESASEHGFTIASGPTDIQLVVDADIERSKITTTEYTDFGANEREGYQMAYTASVQVGFVTKANCRRGNEFVQLDVYPYRNWNASWGSMGDWVNFEAAYAKAFRGAVDGAFDTMAKTSDADDTDDEAAWTNSLWPAAQNVEMQRKFVSARKVEPASNRVFQGVTKFDIEVELMQDAGKEFNAQSLQQSWNSELSRNGQEAGPSSDFRILHDVGIWSPPGGLFSRTDACYTDISAIRVWQRRVVFNFKGELRRRTVLIWSDFDSGIALPKAQSNTVQDLVNRSIRSAAREFSSSR